MTQTPTTNTDDTVLLEEMFVQVARTVTSDQTTLTMHDVSPSTLYFSDRPERVVGHLTTEQFVEQWTEGPNSFFEDPPNAVLSYVGTGEDTPSDAVVVLRDPVVSGSSLSYSIEVLEMASPTESPNCASSSGRTSAPLFRSNACEYGRPSCRVRRP